MIDVDGTAPKMSPSSDVAPTVCESGDTLQLAYRLPARVSASDACAVIRFVGVRDWHYGYPNDEGLDSHPLYGLGLRLYEFHVTPVASHGERCWVATFHEGTFTVYAQQMEVLAERQAGDPPSAIRSLLGDGSTRALDDAASSHFRDDQGCEPTPAMASAPVLTLPVSLAAGAAVGYGLHLLGCDVERTVLTGLGVSIASLVLLDITRGRKLRHWIHRMRRPIGDGRSPR